MKTSEIRQRFLNYFKKQGHEIVASSSLVPGNDPTLLFTNAGMVQFKDVFLGDDNRVYKRAASSQRCVRAGGKHNDLDNVGYTARHHTFFEMLGNFSFGDYFKEDAIKFAWEFITKALKIPKEKLWVSVFKDDDEAFDVWVKKIGIDPDRVSRCGEKDNFWAMGDTGPCGPCTEIFYDHGPEIPGGPPGTPEEEGDRYIEIWNLVFMQYNRTADGEMKPLPNPSVDTGMGLERIAAVMQHVHSNYEIDIFQNLINEIASLAQTRDLLDKSLRVIADHIRAICFLITDSVIPSNEGRGYVLRRIMRRAIRHGHHLGLRKPFLHKLVKPLIKEMGDAYPELKKAQKHIEKIILREEEQFDATLDQGLKILEQKIKQLKTKVVPGELVFRLYDTYGFPADLTADVVRDRGLAIDDEGFEEAMAKQRAQSQQASKFDFDYTAKLDVEGETEFTGYECLHDKAKITDIYHGQHAVKALKEKEIGVVVLNRTPFYAESGGQVGDTGQLVTENALFRVQDTQKQGAVYLHYGYVERGEIEEGDKINAQVDSTRQATVLNHSATHLLHSALRYILGDHVQQKGSLVAPDRLRFDFAHYEALAPGEIAAVEALVNQQIRANLASTIEVMTPESAKKSGALALFGEKYGDEVRVLSMGEFSKELCGGTHAKRTGDIGFFKIISEGGIAAGIRRLEAVTGESALQWINAAEKKSAEKVAALSKEKRILEKEIQHLKQKLAGQKSGDLLSSAKNINGVKVLAAELPGVDMQGLRAAVDQLKNNLDKAAILLATVQEGKVQMVAGVTKNCTDKIKAGEMIQFVAKQIDGKGGGRPDMAQGGGNNAKALPAALESIYAWVEKL